MHEYLCSRWPSFWVMGGQDYALIDRHKRSMHTHCVNCVLLPGSYIVITVLLGSMGLGGLPGVGRSNHVDSAEFYFKKMGVR